MPQMANQVWIEIAPDMPGGFNAHTFDHLIQQRISLPVLNLQYVHTLLGARVAEDGSVAQLLVRSEPIAPMRMDRHLRVLNGVPPAHVRAVTPDGEVVHEAQLSAPLRPGQKIQIGSQDYYVGQHEWPGRHPETGVCHGAVDWQQVTVTPIAPEPSGPVLAELPAPAPGTPIGAPPALPAPPQI